MFRIRKVTAAARAMEELRSAASQLKAALGGTEASAKREDLCGYDRYDPPISQFVRLPLLHSIHWVRLATQQVLKRLTVNVRPLLGTWMHSSAVTFSRLLQGNGHLFALRGDRRGHYGWRVKVCLERIDGLRSSDDSGDCWGADVQCIGTTKCSSRR
jgi:hypothetical protein